MRKMAFVAFMLTVTAAPGIAHQKAQANPQVASVLPDLRSEDWSQRAKAFEQLRSDSNVRNDPKVQKDLLSLLDRENQLVESTLRDSHGRIGVSAKYGEGFGEYVSELGETVDGFGNWSDSNQVCIFVHESYNPDSRFAAKIASHAILSVPCLIKMYGSDVGLIRAEAAPVLVQSLAKGKDQLDSATTRKAKEAVLAALHDPEEAVRSSTIEALGTFGGEDMIPALRQVAQTDPSPEVQGYSIRKMATKAIGDIQKRTHK